MQEFHKILKRISYDSFRSIHHETRWLESMLIEGEPNEFMVRYVSHESDASVDYTTFRCATVETFLHLMNECFRDGILFEGVVDLVKVVRL